MASGKRPKYQWKRISDHSFLFAIQNVDFGYILCHLENWFFHLYVFLNRFMEECSIPDKLKYRKKAPL